MSKNPMTVLRMALGLLLAFSCLHPLRAQFAETQVTQAKLNPTSATDFTDLFKQSTSVQAKPEILTVFDFSRSMASLMFHPLYYNNDISDLDEYRYMKFQLTSSEGSGGAVTTTTYTIYAKTADHCITQAYAQVKVGSDGSIAVTTNTPGASCGLTGGSSAPPNLNVKVTAGGNSSANATLTYKPDCNTNTASCNNTKYSLTNNGASGTQGSSATTYPGQYTITHADGSQTVKPVIEAYIHGTSNLAGAGPFPPGTVLDLVAYVYHISTEGDPAPPSGIGTPVTGIYAGSWSGTGISAGPTVTTGTTGIYKTTATLTVPPWTYVAPVQTYQTTQLQPITVSPAGPYTLGQTLTFSDYFVAIGDSTGRLNWTTGVSNSCGKAAGSTSPTFTTGNTQTGPGGSVTWTIPNCTPSASGSSKAVVTVTLDASPGTAYSVPGLSYPSPSTLSATTSDSDLDNSALRKPDGSPVTQTDVDNATINLPGGNMSPHANDVRNWIRAASHVRFTNQNRTIDIPIPWKIFIQNPGQTSQTIPLTSATVTDSEKVETQNPDHTTTTTYVGTGTAIELDKTYNINGQAGGVLTTDTVGSTANSNSQVTTVYLYSTVYRPSYIAWLFQGKYQGASGDPNLPYYTADSSFMGKYIVFNSLQTSGDTNNATYGAAGQGTNVGWGAGFGSMSATDTYVVPQFNFQGLPKRLDDGTFAPSISKLAKNYRIPALTRAQAVKSAAITTWTQNQADVFWAFRFLDTNNEALTSGGAPATTIDNNTKKSLQAGNPTTTHMDGVDSGWVVLNNSTASPNASVTGMNRIASLFANGSTPLTYAMARSLAQFGDPGSAFNDAEGSNVSQCVSRFLMLFTDGVDNNGVDGSPANLSATPYLQPDPLTGAIFLDPIAGNDAIIGSTARSTLIGKGGAYWNLHTFAGIGAHLGDLTLGAGHYMPPWVPPSGVTTQTPDQFLPFSISGRNGITFNVPALVTTMTVGVSLGGAYTNTASPKYSLFLAAVEGKAKQGRTALSVFHPFTAVDIDPITLEIANEAAFYFDANDSETLQSSMALAFQVAKASSGNNATSSPTLPFLGASVGQEIYTGSFQPPVGGGVIWPGDLMMFGTQVSGSTVNILDKSGAVTTTLSKEKAVWASSNALATSKRFWDPATLPATSAAARNLWTRLPSTSTTEPALSQFTYATKNADGSGNTAFDDGSGGGLQKYVATSQSYSTKQVVVQRAMGGDTLNSGTPPSVPPTVNRNDIMGDIIGSSPNAVGYTLSDWAAKLPPALSGSQPSDGSGLFRVILVGTNQGWIHAFGEITSSKTNLGAAVDELWAFMPTDFLNNLDWINGLNNPHRLMADGPVAVYNLDLPTSSGTGNGKIDVGERAIAVFGLGKGGRSYYALDISNPFKPALKWSLVPDESANFNTNRNLTKLDDTALKTLISHMGYSTGTPAFGRILHNNVLRDAVFLGGGFSVPAVDTAFGTGLGRSILALDVYTGQVLAAVDLASVPLTASQKAIGPVGSGVIPFEFILNSGMAQRAYFMDYTGGLFAWGSKALGSGAYSNFRADSSEIKNWNIRRVFQDDNTMSESGTGTSNRYTTPPAPFKVGTFAGPVLSGEITPAAVGIAIVSGDRNNPVDQYPAGGPNGLAPSRHQLAVVFDRQDSFALGLDDGQPDNGPDTGIKPNAVAGAYTGQLVPLPTGDVITTPAPIDCNADDDSDKAYQVFTAGCPRYFLGNGTTSSNWKYGFYVNFPGIDSTTGFVSKGINPPLVNANSLFYSYFTPTQYDYCNGGLGNTYSRLIVDVMHPIYSDKRTDRGPLSGSLFTWAGVSSNFISVGNQIIQGGTITSGTNGITTGSATATPYINATPLGASQQHPRVRVWRTVQ